MDEMYSSSHSLQGLEGLRTLPMASCMVAGDFTDETHDASSFALAKDPKSWARNPISFMNEEYFTRLAL